MDDNDVQVILDYVDEKLAKERAAHLQSLQSVAADVRHLLDSVDEPLAGERAIHLQFWQSLAAEVRLLEQRFKELADLHPPPGSKMKVIHRDSRGNVRAVEERIAPDSPADAIRAATEAAKTIASAQRR